MHGPALDDQALLARLREPLVVQHPEVAHLAEDHVPPLARALGMLDGRVGVRGPDDPRERGGLAEREPLDVLAEEAARCCADAVHGEAAVLAEVDAVQVGREDLVLGVAPLEREGEPRLAHLPSPRPLRRQHEVLDELLGERASSLGEPAAPNVHPDGACHGADVHPGMLEESLILGGQHGLDEVLRHGQRRMPQLVGGPAQARERLGLELDLLQRLAGDREQLANSAAVHQEPDRERRAGGPGIVARPEVDFPQGRLATELPGRRRS